MVHHRLCAWLSSLIFKMTIVCLVPHMYAMMKIRLYKIVIKWKQGLIVNNCYWLPYDTDTFSNLLADEPMVCEDHRDSKIHGANMGPTWVLSAPDGPHVGPMNLAIWALELVVYDDAFFTSCILICFMTIPSVQREKFCVNNIKN